MTNRHIIDRALPERAKLQFWFPNTSEGEEYFVVDLPFFENPSIKETKKARNQKYSLTSRSSNLYAYLGADSRQMDVSFNINLAHILEEHPGLQMHSYLNTRGSFQNSEAEQERFWNRGLDESKSIAAQLGTAYLTENVTESAAQVLDSDWAASGITQNEHDDIVKSYGLQKNKFKLSDVAKSRLLDQTITGYSDDPVALAAFGAMGSTPVIGAAAQLIWARAMYSNAEFKQKTVKNRMIDLIIYWVNIIRCSVINNAQNPIYGPPVIRLNHGIMFQNVPCICNSYNISWVESAGYDVQTLLPRQIKVQMKLEELRTGDFGKFTGDSNNPLTRDNLAGWESVVLGTENGRNSLDPGYGGEF